LATALHVDDGKAPMPQRHATIDYVGAVIGPSVLKDVTHPFNDAGLDETHGAYDTTHRDPTDCATIVNTKIENRLPRSTRPLPERCTASTNVPPTRGKAEGNGEGSSASTPLYS
jgi:hypothetical protein